MKALIRWLSRAPISDPVDRRNAPFLQVLLLFFGLFTPLNKGLWLYAVASGRWSQALPGKLAMAADLGTDVLITIAAWIALFWIRRGRFRPAVTLFIATALFSVGIVYASTGLAHLPFDPIPLLMLFLAGMLMGRRALWVTLATLAATLAACLALDFVRAALAHGAVPTVSIGKAVSLVGIWLVVAMMLDRTVAALRDSLDESNARARELETAYGRLQLETAERERTRDQLIHAQKVEATGRLAGGVAHDFNNVLNVILNSAKQRELIADRGSPALLGALENVELAARRALAINRKLLNLSRQEVNSPQTFDAGLALRELQPMLRQLLGAQIMLTLECGNTPLPVRVDHGRFELMVLNIAANARDAITGSGEFRIVACRDEASRCVLLRLGDSGTGMSEAVRARALEPFYTTKPADYGTGLGLSVVHDMLTEAGGDIAIESTPGVGTTVNIRLPLAA